MNLLRPSSVLISALILASGCAPEAARPTLPPATGAAPAPAVVEPAPGNRVPADRRMDTAGPATVASVRVPSPVVAAPTPPVRPLLIDGIPVAEPDYQAQAESVKEAVRTGRHPERLTPLVEPVPFDREAYRRDPGKYLNVVEPGRAMQPGEPGPGVPILMPIGPDLLDVRELGAVSLLLRSAPRAPVSFTSLDMGSFANGLSAITVQADDDGVATAVFTATRGTILETHIIAASPMAEQQRTLLVRIHAEQEPEVSP